MSENNNKNNQTEELDMNRLMQIRRDKLKELQDEGKNPYELLNLIEQIQLEK